MWTDLRLCVTTKTVHVGMHHKNSALTLNFINQMEHLNSSHVYFHNAKMKQKHTKNQILLTAAISDLIARLIKLDCY